MQQAKYQIYVGEYDNYVVNPNDGLLYNVGLAGTPITKISPLSTVFKIAAETGTNLVKGSACLHHAAFIDKDGYVWVIGDNTNNITLTGAKPVTVPLTKTTVNNAAQVVAYANGGDPNGLGWGVMVLTNDGKVLVWGNTQSGFRGDGTEGNVAENTPFTVPLQKPIQSIFAEGYAYALSTDGTVYQWGGTKQDPYWAQFASGRGSSKNLSTIAIVPIPEPVTQISGGTYALGKSGEIYGWAYNTNFLGLKNTNSQLTPFKLKSVLNLVNTPVQFIMGTEATYALMPNGDLYSWGNNSQAAVGNGQEAAITQKTKVAPWGPTADSLFVYTPTKVNPAGVSFVKVFAGTGDAFYVFAEDTNGTLYSWGRNKYNVLWNGKGSNDGIANANFPNTWDVLSPTAIAGFGTIVTPPPTNPCPPCPDCPPVPASIIKTVTTVTWVPGANTQTVVSTYYSDGSVANS